MSSGPSPTVLPAATDRLIEELIGAVHDDPVWVERLTRLRGANGSPFSLHLAVFVEPYLQYVLQGAKTIESRFSLRRSAPYGRVRPDDLLLLKRSGGPITGICTVSNVWLYHLDPASWQFIRREFAQALCAQDPAFWQQRGLSRAFGESRRAFAVWASLPFFTLLPLTPQQQHRKGAPAHAAGQNRRGRTSGA